MCSHLLRCLRHCLVSQARADFSRCSKARCLCAKTLSARPSSWTDLKSFYPSGTFKSKPALQKFLALPALPHPLSPCQSLMKGRSPASCKDIFVIHFVFCHIRSVFVCVCEYCTRILCSIPGCNYIFVLQLFYFSHRRVDDNVVDVVNTLSLTLAHKALKGRQRRKSWHNRCRTWSKLPHLLGNAPHLSMLEENLHSFCTLLILYFVIVDLQTGSVKSIIVLQCVLPVGSAWMEPWWTSALEIHLNCPLCQKAGRGNLHLDNAHKTVAHLKIISVSSRI